MKREIVIFVMSVIAGGLIGFGGRGILDDPKQSKSDYQLTLFHQTKHGKDSIRIEDNGRYVGCVALDSCGKLSDEILNDNQ